ncbi:cupin domain-containing protein [Siccirubricoccus sp. G192]|uniref:cupin domain-containing protein n=1 Tax=Siccirubricoccus sp. G192 TaxID=2849651 RepID=UPI001C2BCBF8|nr:cupin domain-containing protein [Siccirubricoccus sp. G192]MBV1800198.1 cupin domain-containing protein [Siccirubricoccus sp. G192]
MPDKPIAIRAKDAPPRARPSNYPPDLVARIGAREKHPLGEFFGLRNFGVNLTRLPPGTASALRHAHALQDEFVYILEGTPVLVTDAGETPLAPGICAGFPCGTGNAHHLVNRSAQDVVYLEVGDRTRGDSVDYPDDDLMVRPDAEGRARFLRKNGTPL